MSDPAETYFPDERPAWDFVRNDFPFPLAITCTRLLGEMERQEPIAAAWALRDAFECIIKFSASLAVADFMNAGPDPTAAGEVAQLLLKPSGLSLGDWHTLLEMALKPLKPLVPSGRLHESGRALPLLFEVFFMMKGQSPRTPLNRKIAVDQDSFVAWRNRVFGHGVFNQDRSYYAQETLAWLPVLGDFYAALRLVLTRRHLISQTPNGDEVVWQGAGDVLLLPPHEHEPWGDPLPMFLAPALGFDLPTLPLTPFLSMQQCQSCGQPAAFFFDKNKYDRKQDRHATTFLEYFSGHPGTRRDWSETRQVAALLPPAFDWERTSYDGEEVDGSLSIVFRDLEAEYQRPDYLLDAVWRITEDQNKGYIHLVGPGGIGKSFFIRGLAAEGEEQGAAVLSYYILPGALTDARTFLSELNAYARDTLRFRTQEPQMRGASPADMQAEFVSYLSALMRSNRIDLLVIAIDALDELADPADRTIGITDFLPPPDLLPDRCFFVLTSREELRPKVRADIIRLEAAAPQGFTAFTLGSGDTANQGLLRAYLAKHLPLPLQAPEKIDAVLVRCGGIFLYAFHLCRALEAGVFTDVTALPDGAEFYPAYLERLRSRAGDHLYETVYLPTLLLLCAAQQPVTLEQLTRWGVPDDRLQFALLDLRDFLRVHRELPWQDRLGEPDGENRYAIAHDAFVRYIQSDISQAVRLRIHHGLIARHALMAYPPDWDNTDTTASDTLYDLRFALRHLEYARMIEEVRELQSNERYATICRDTAAIADKSRHFQVAISLLNTAIVIYDRVEDTERLANAIMNKGTVLGRSGSFADALMCLDEAASVLRPLAEAGREDIHDSLALVLMNKGVALEMSGRLDEALTCHDGASAIWKQIAGAVRNEPANRPLAEAGLARVLTCRSVTLGALGRLDQALSCLDEASTIYRSLVAVGRKDLSGELASALANRGVALDKLGCPDQALSCFSEAATIYRLHIESCPDDLDEYRHLATTLINRAMALLEAGSLADALICFDEAAAILRPLAEAGREDVSSQLAALLMRKGAILGAEDRSSEALGCLEEATKIYRYLVRADYDNMADRLARSLTAKGVALGTSGHLDRALNCFDEAAAIGHSLVAAGRKDLAQMITTNVEMRELFDQKGEDKVEP